ncbi:MAG: mandelate racemase/muconate lactonizing enzyme family protein [Chitinophagaceae bacterium]|nr:mandelate racemase/muconate lactonizing enzyme family protein [Chitinophagaceae bacterium]
MKISSSNIRDYHLYETKVELGKNISDATHTLTEISFLVLRLRLENGIIGESYLLTFQYSPGAIRGAFADLLPLVAGIPAYETGRVREVLDRQSEYFGNSGINRWAGAAINIAMWDAWGKTLGMPLWKLWGVYREKIMMYGSGGWLSYSVKELLEEVTSYVERGFKAVKIKVGSTDWREDIRRLSAVRQEVGDHIDIMMDANQGMDLASAIALVREARELNIYWFEEPLGRTDFDGYKSLKQHTGISLAMGEREYDLLGLKNLLQRKAIDIWQPDLLRIGGVEDWRESAALAHAYHIPVLPHYYKDYDITLTCTIPNGKGIESFDWIDTIIDHPLTVKDGYAYLQDRPGWGFNFLDKSLREIV